jgi:hypothetical protein
MKANATQEMIGAAVARGLATAAAARWPRATLPSPVTLTSAITLLLSLCCLLAVLGHRALLRGRADRNRAKSLLLRARGHQLFALGR